MSLCSVLRKWRQCADAGLHFPKWDAGKNLFCAESQNKTKNENVLTKHNLKAYPYMQWEAFLWLQQILWRQGGKTTILGDFTDVYINLVVTQNNFPFLLGEGCIFVFSQQFDLAKLAVVSELTFCICSDFKGWFQICLCCSQIWIWTLTSAGFNLGWQTCCRYWKIKSKQEWFLYRLCGGKRLEEGGQHINAESRQQMWWRLHCVMYFYRTYLYCLWLFISAAWHFENCQER